MHKQQQNDRPKGQPRVSIKAPARLHLGFIDLHGGLGRSFGSLGVGLSDIYTHVTATTSDDVIIHGPSSNRASLFAGRMLEFLNIKQGAEITIHECIPEHAGLGSGTQLSLAVGTAITKLYNKFTPTREIANVMERGARSGIGVGAFSTGGFLVDGGRGEHTVVPPIISHIHFPESWRILLVFDHAMNGVNGETERKFFQHQPQMNEHITQQLCRLTLMQLLPALAEEDCEQFGAAITEIQRQVGDHFSIAQGGRFCSQLVAGTLPWLMKQGATGVGQSSWGPTGFAIFANETQAYQALKKIREDWLNESRLTFKVCKARNEKAEIKVDECSTMKKASFKNII
jgi:beta-ribofuranosylaminobenzene 5'-phosphate synthase